MLIMYCSSGGLIVSCVVCELMRFYRVESSKSGSTFLVKVLTPALACFQVSAPLINRVGHRSSGSMHTKTTPSIGHLFESSGGDCWILLALADKILAFSKHRRRDATRIDASVTCFLANQDLS